MPRQAHGRSLQSTSTSKQRKRKTVRSSALNALETAERQNPDDIKVRQHRLGEIEDDSDDPQSRADLDDRSSKRRKITNEGEAFEPVDAEGSDLEGGRWHEGVDEDDEDSDIDSDEAFGESDEEKFAHFSFRGSKDDKKKAKPTNQKKPHRVQSHLADDEGWETADVFNNVNEESGSGQSVMDDEEEEEDDLGEDAVDLATALDMNEEEERKEAERLQRKAGKRPPKQRGQANEASDVEEDNDDDDDENISDDDEVDQETELSISDDEEQNDLAGLQQFVAGLATPNDTNRAQRQKSTRALPDKPSQFGLGSAKISASDLLQYVKDPAQRQSLKILQASERQGPEEYKGGIPGKLAAPLAKRQQDKLDRAAAYEKSKETLNRWIDTVKQNRRAEHLSFPLPDPAMQSATSTKQLAPTSYSAPVTSLEATIQNIMQESGLGVGKGQSIEDQEQAYEELQEKTVPLEEVRARRAELRQARELMFREEIRAKRIKKIKSKAYRRVHRKERDRIEARRNEELAASGLLNSDDERERNERVRAEERMGARHRESRWAKGVKATGRAAWDQDARGGVVDLARRDEELRRRVEGKSNVDSDASQSESESDAYDTDTDDRQLAAKLNTLDSVNDAPKSKLASMAFMLKAEAARKAENDEETRQLRLALRDEDDDAASSDEEDDTIVGRQKFGVNSQSGAAVSKRRETRNEFEARLSEDDKDDQDDQMEPLVTDEPRVRNAAVNGNSGKNNEHVKSDSSKLRSQQNVSRRSAEMPPLQVGSTKKKPSSLATPQPKAQEQALDDYTSPSESGDEARTPDYTGDDSAALSAAIFAGPEDVAQAFAKEKKDTVEDEGDQVTDNTLPGWGSWTGTGVSKREQKKAKGRFLTTVKGIAPEKRQDARLERVIINEKRIKKNSKYLATELPHPFENRQQYERSLRLPMGPEWGTVNHFQDAIKPRVLLKQGNIIKPMAKPIA